MKARAGRASSKNGQGARSAKTRASLLKAAIEVFGAVGYDAASTRELAQKAKANLAAIPYHFGGKRELYLAAAREIATYARGRLEEIAEVLTDPGVENPASRLETALVKFLYLIVDDAEPRAWTAFLARCIYENDAAYLLIHEAAIAPFQQRLCEVAKLVSPSTFDDETVRLRISAIVSAIISFRLLRGLVLRGMGWTEIRPEDAHQIDAMVRDLARSNFLTTRLTDPLIPTGGTDLAWVRKKPPSRSKGKSHE